MHIKSNISSVSDLDNPISSKASWDNSNIFVTPELEMAVKCEWVTYGKNAGVNIRKLRRLLKPNRSHSDDDYSSQVQLMKLCKPQM